MRLTQKTLDTLPTVRLYISSTKSYYTVYYMNARKTVELDLEYADFKENGKGLPWNCGISNAGLRQKNRFNHPVFYVHTIGSVVYVVAIETKNGMPKFAFRYRHRSGKIIDAYDKSRKDPTKIRLLKRLLEQCGNRIILEKGRSESGKGTHSPGAKSGHRVPGAPHGDANKVALSGAHRRAVAAGYIPPEMST